MTIRYVLRDIATEGADFLLWGENDLAAAIVSLVDAHLDGIGHELELIAYDPSPYRLMQ